MRRDVNYAYVAIVTTVYSLYVIALATGSSGRNAERRGEESGDGSGRIERRPVESNFVLPDACIHCLLSAWRRNPTQSTRKVRHEQDISEAGSSGAGVEQ